MQDKKNVIAMPLYFHLSKEKLYSLPSERIDESRPDKYINQDLFPNRKITPHRFYKRISTHQLITNESRS